MRFEFLASAPTFIFSLALAANLVAASLSLTASSELTKSLASGPRISLRAAVSNDSAAWTRASAASLGVANSFCLAVAVLVAAGFGSAASRKAVAKAETAIAKTSTEIFVEFITLALVLF